MALACVVNNWIEVRSDATKICYAQRRPIPLRDDSIGPWLDNISFLTWLGTITTSTLILLFRGNEASVFEFDRAKIIWLLVVVFIAEHGYWIIDRAAGSLARRFRTKGEIEILRDEYILRRKEMSALERRSGETTSDGGIMEKGWRLSEDQPANFWKERSLEKTVHEAKSLLVGWKKESKIQ